MREDSLLQRTNSTSQKRFGLNNHSIIRLHNSQKVYSLFLIKHYINPTKLAWELDLIESFWPINHTKEISLK